MAALAQTEDEKRQAAAAMESAKAKIAEYQSSQQFATAMKNATPEVAAYYQKAYQENQLRGRIQNAQQETGMGAQSAQEQVGKIVGRDQMGVDASGNKDAARALGEKATEAQYNASIQAAGTGKAFADLSINIGKSPEALAKLDTGIKTVFGPGGSVEQAAERQKGAVKKIFDEISGPGAGAGGQAKTPAGGGQERLPKPKAEGGSYYDGTKEVTGDWFGKDFGKGMLAEVHGPEALVPKPKLGEFLSDMLSKLPKPAAKQQDSELSMPSIPSPAPMQAQSMDTKTMNDLHKQLVDLNIGIRDVSMKMADVSNHTASTAKYSKAATGNRNA
jgi:hypothetical protein